MLLQTSGYTIIFPFSSVYHEQIHYISNYAQSVANFFHGSVRAASSHLAFQAYDTLVAGTSNQPLRTAPRLADPMLGSDSAQLMIEMPPGSGKTVCIWAVALAALESRPDARVRFMTRTIAQVDKAGIDLQRCLAARAVHNPAQKSLVATPRCARRHLCLFDPVKSAANVDRACNAACRPSGQHDIEDADTACPYYTKTLEYERTGGTYLRELLKSVKPTFSTEHDLSLAPTIQDLRVCGNTHGVCPHMLANALRENATVTIEPYTYTLDPLGSKKTARNAAASTQKEVLIQIFDEAHSLEDIARDSCSKHIDTDLFCTFGSAVLSVKSWIPRVTNPTGRILLPQVTSQLADPFGACDRAAEALFNVVSQRQSLILQCDVREIAATAAQAAECSEYGLHIAALHVLDRMNLVRDRVFASGSALTEDRRSQVLAAEENVSAVCEFICFLCAAARIHEPDRDLLPIFGEVPSVGKHPFTVFVTRSKTSVLCLDASVAISRAVSRPNTEIHTLLTSGTLAPFSVTARLLGLPALTGTHSINLTLPRQNTLSVFIAATGTQFVSLTAAAAGSVGLAAAAAAKRLQLTTQPSERSEMIVGHRISAAFANRANPEMIEAFGTAIHSVCMSCPDGVLAFGPSRAYIRELIQGWKHQGTRILDKIAAQKLIFLDDTNTNETAMPEAPSSAAPLVSDLQLALLGGLSLSGVQSVPHMQVMNDSASDIVAEVNTRYTIPSDGLPPKPIRGIRSRQPSAAVFRARAEARRLAQSREQLGLLGLYQNSVDSARGALLLSVARSIFSEGIDFSSGYGRACLVLGVPFMAPSPHSMAYSEYTEHVHAISGDTLMRLSACRAVAQCVCKFSNIRLVV